MFAVPITGGVVYEAVRGGNEADAERVVGIDLAGGEGTSESGGGGQLGATTSGPNAGHQDPRRRSVAIAIARNVNGCDPAYSPAPRLREPRLAPCRPSGFRAISAIVVPALGT